MPRVEQRAGFFDPFQSGKAEVFSPRKTPLPRTG
jgi:hypothetical protein